MRLSFRLALADHGSTLPPDDTAKAPAAYECSRVRLWTPAPFIDLGSGGCIIGPVFRRTQSSGRIGELEPDEARAIVTSEEHTSELQSLMRISYAVFCLTKKTHKAS